jgi:hypothetical protein
LPKMKLASSSSGLTSGKGSGRADYRIRKHGQCKQHLHE